MLALIFLVVFLQTHCSEHLFFLLNIMLTYSRFRYMILIHDQTVVRACTLRSSLKGLNLLCDCIFFAWVCSLPFSLQCCRQPHYREWATKKQHSVNTEINTVARTRAKRKAGYFFVAHSVYLCRLCKWGGVGCIAACFMYRNDGRTLIEFDMNVMESVITHVCKFSFFTIGNRDIDNIPI